MSLPKNGISPEDFYGGKNSRQEIIEAILEQDNYENQKQQRPPKFMSRLLGPTTTWKVFRKQQEAIECCILRKNGLMPFAFEDVNGRRMFLAAHPKVFWALNCHRFFKNCSSYEIIREHSTCKLYLDIEFEHDYNDNKNGERMLQNVLDVINFNLKSDYNITCTRNEILDLDSSSDTKFSHHVIYQIENTAFKDNYAVGSFVKKISSELRSAFESSLSGDDTKLKEVADKYALLPNDILELFVFDRKGQTKLFVDEGVYTKNRHFRLLGSSKRNKNIPLKISHTNKYKLIKGSAQIDYFLDSLITYFSTEVKRILECSEPEPSKPHWFQKHSKPQQTEKQKSTVHEQIDSFINSLIMPGGSIRSKVFFSDSSTIVYNIQGFRFCENIKREHKSNNIKYIVDLEGLQYYQKCYDPDCADFRSDMKRLPEEICFLFEDDTMLDDDFEKFLAENKCDDSFDQCIPEEDLELVADFAENLLYINW